MKKSLFLLSIGVLLLAGCKKEQPTTPDTPAPQEGINRIYILNEGPWGGNAGEIAIANPNTGDITNEWFSTANGRGLGDVAQDLLHYGGKLYVTVSYSHTVEVIDPATGRSLKQISLAGRTPRHLACHNGKVYVSCYDKSIARIDTAALSIDGNCPLSGMQPEQLCVLGNELYICNSWQYGEGGSIIYDSTLSVVDLATFSETTKIAVGTNPSRIKPLDDHRLVIACAGDYGNAAATTLIYDLNTHSVHSLPIAFTNFDIYKGNIYGYAVAYDGSWNPTAAFYSIDGNTLAATPILTSYGSILADAYGINLNPSNGDIYICNSPYTGVNGDIYCFTSEGAQRWHAEAGLMASKVVF